MDQTFIKNIQALKALNPDLALELENITELQKYEVLQDGEKSVDLNIFDHQTKQFIYKSPKAELSDQLIQLQVCKNYKYLYLFGTGNGFLLLSLLLNHHAKRIYLFEPEPELLYITLHLHDFSEYIANGHLQIWQTSQINFANACTLLQEDDALMHTQHFSLISTSYYALYQDIYMRLKEDFIDARHYLYTLMGNNITDSIKGITQFVQNIGYLYKSPTLKQLQNTKKGQPAIIVSTGPSLNKQLPLLKKVAKYVTLISVDASLPILYAHDIKPDVVVSIERDEPTSKFFTSISKEFQKEILFICASLQHETVFEAIQEGTLMSVLRPMGEYRYFQLDDYGYLGGGASAANMAHDLAHYLGISKVILIGQDLSFNKEGETHTKGHIFEQNDLIEKEKKENRLLKIPAYGGKGLVDTHIYWFAFKQALEYGIAKFHSEMITINATEGGAHIIGTVEQPFEKLCQEFLQLSEKNPIHITPPLEKEQFAVKKQTKIKMKKLLKEGKKVRQKIHYINNQIAAFNPASDLTKSIQLYNDIINTRKSINHNSSFVQFFISLIMPSIFQDDLRISTEDTKFYETDHERIICVIQANAPLWEKLLKHTDNILSVLEQ